MLATLRTADEAQAAGYAQFGNGPHLCVSVSTGFSTITCRLPNGRRVTFAFGFLTGGRIPQCVRIQYHDAGPLNVDGAPVFDVALHPEGVPLGSVQPPLYKVPLVEVHLSAVPQPFDPAFN